MFDIEEELKKLPDKPGVYLMKDKNDNIILEKNLILELVEDFVVEWEEYVQGCNCRNEPEERGNVFGIEIKTCYISDYYLPSPILGNAAYNSDSCERK